MTDTSTNVALRPPRIEEGYAFPTPERRSGFLGTARAMAAPAVEAARESLAASRGGVGDYFLNMPLAALNLADAGFRGGVGAFADLVPGLSAAQRRDLAREVAAVPEAFAASVGRVPEAVDEGVGALSEVARRMFQPGPMPETLYSNPPFDPDAFIRQHFGPERKAAADAQRLREELDANDQLRAERGLPPLNPPPRTADQMRETARARLAERDAMVARLTEDDAPVRFAGGDLTALVSRSPDREGWRVTVFQPDGSPSGHSNAPDKASAVRRALEDQFRPVGLDSRTAAPAPRDFGFTQDNPGGRWLQSKQDRADEAMAESERGLGRRGITGSVTGTMGMRTDMFLPTDRLSGLTGLMDENRRPGDVKFDALLARVREEGFDPNQAGNRIVIAVNHRGEPYVLEGNTRIAVARELGIPNVKAEVRYWNGGEDVDGPFSPENVSRIAARGPSGSRPENFAQGGAVMMRSDMPEQLHQGVGSLSEVARRMFQGGAVSGGHPLDQYGQYLTQTYAEPIQRLASDAVNQFVDSVRQKEQAYFGGGGMGGGMGSPLQGGLMGSPFEAMAGGTFDAQVAAAQNTPAMPSHQIGRRLADPPPRLGLGVPQMPMQPLIAAPAGPSNLSFGVMEGFAPPVNDGFAERAMVDGPESTARYMRNAALFDQSLRGPSPFGNNIVNQQMLGQARLEERPTGVPLSTSSPFGRIDPSIDLSSGAILSPTDAIAAFSTGQRPSLNPLVGRQGLV